jgi:hypothetical protein
LLKAIKDTISWLFRVIKPPSNENWKVVLLCFLAATTFWFFNALNKNYTTKINHPIQFEFEREGVIIVSEMPSRIQLNVTGGGWNLLRKTLSFNSRPIVIRLDNPTETKFLTANKLYPQISEQVNEMRLNFVAEDTLFFNIERRVIKKLPLAVDSTRIDLEDNYRIVSEITIIPDSIIFEGPSSLIESLPEWIFVSVPKEDINENFSEEVKINFEESNLIKHYPERVKITFEVAQFIERNKIVSVELLNFPEDSTIYLQNSKVRLKYFVEEKFLDQADNTRFKVVANLKRLNKADSTVKPILLEHPDYAHDIIFEPSELKVIFEPKPKVSRNF